MLERSPLPQSLLRLIDDLCAAFERDWLAGSPPPLERLVVSVAEQGRPDLFRELLHLELEHRHQQGRPLTADEARERFAGLGEWVAGILAEVGLGATPACLVLRVIEGPHSGEVFRTCGHSRLLIGRGEMVNVALDQDGKVSRPHLIIEFNPPHARVIDLKSKHGTQLNGRPITEADLDHGDRIQLGKTVFQVSLILTPGEETISGTVLFSARAGSPAPLTALALPAGPIPAVPGYVLEEKLGEGGMGVVYRARREPDGALVALKMVLPALQHRPDLIAKFLREINILGRLDHPNIVRLLASGETGGLLFFAMEHVSGPSAADVVKRGGPLSAERMVRLGCQLLDALAFAHEQGFVHRDIKPSNLLLAGPDDAEQLKLADFGLARAYQDSALSGLTLSGTAGGTAAFMPPEQVFDFRNALPPADQYGAAATLYFLLTGRHIYEKTRSTVDLLLRIQSVEPIPLRDPPGEELPARLGAVLRRALARDPARRYPDARAMRQDLTRAIS